MFFGMNKCRGVSCITLMTFGFLTPADFTESSTIRSRNFRYSASVCEKAIGGQISEIAKIARHPTGMNNNLTGNT